VTDVFGLLASGTCQVLAKGQENTHTKHCSRRNEGRERRNKTTIAATTQQPQQHTAASTLHNKSKRRRRDGHRRSVYSPRRRIGCSLYLSTAAGIRRRFPLSLTQATFSASWFAALPQSLVLGIAGARRFLVLLRWVWERKAPWFVRQPASLHLGSPQHWHPPVLGLESAAVQVGGLTRPWGSTGGSCLTTLSRYNPLTRAGLFVRLSLLLPVFLMFLAFASLT